MNRIVIIFTLFIFIIGVLFGLVGCGDGGKSEMLIEIKKVRSEQKLLSDRLEKAEGNPNLFKRLLGESDSDEVSQLKDQFNVLWSKELELQRKIDKLDEHWWELSTKNKIGLWFFILLALFCVFIGLKNKMSNK